MSDEITGAVDAEVTDPDESVKDSTDWKAEARKWEARAKESNAKVKELEPAKAKLTELEEANQSELEKAIARAEAAERKAAEVEEAATKKERAALLKVVAAEKKVPAKWLSGDTQEELERSADEWLEDAKGLAPARPAGHVPSAGTGDGSSASSLEEVRERAKRFASK